jgi:Flp pilus assembly protein TadG
MRGKAAGKSRHGVVLIEAAIVIGLLMLLTFGLIEFGHYLFVRHTMKGAAWAGVREAILPTATDTKVFARIDEVMGAAGIRTYGKQVEPPVESATATRGATIKVTVVCTWEDVGVSPMGLISPTTRLQVDAVMLKE